MNPGLHTAQTNNVRNVPLEFISDGDPAVGAQNITPHEDARYLLPPDPVMEAGAGRHAPSGAPGERRMHVLHENPYWHMATPQEGAPSASVDGEPLRTLIPYNQLLLLHYYQNREGQGEYPGSLSPATVNQSRSATQTTLATMPRQRAVHG